MVGIRSGWWMLGSLAFLAGCASSNVGAADALDGPAVPAPGSIWNEAAPSNVDVGEQKKDKTGGPNAVEELPVAIGARIGAMLERAHYAFRRQGNVWTGGHADYGVRVDDTGFSFTSYVMTDLVKRTSTAGTPARFQTLSISRDGKELLSGERKVSQLADGSLAVNEGMATETLANTSAGVEQSWVLDRAPSGSGDLVFRVGETGLTFTSDANGSVKFHDAKGVDISYSAVTWVDAKGKRTSLSPKWVNGAIEMRVPSSVLETSTFPAVLDPTIGAGGSASAPERNVTVSSGNGVFLLTWEDYAGGTPRVLGGRVRADGVALDSFGLAFSSSTEAQLLPSSTFDGSDFLVVWTEGVEFSGQIRGAVVPSTGGAAGTPFAVGTGTGEAWPNARCSGVGNCLVAFNRADGSGIQQLYGRRIISGVPGSEVTITSSSYDQIGPMVASDGTDYLVAWEGYDSTGVSHIWASPVSGAGSVGSLISVTGSDPGWQYWTALTYVNGSYLIGYTHWQDGDDEDLFAKQVVGGVVTGETVTLANTSQNENQPNFSTNGTTVLVSYGRDDGIYALRLDASFAWRDATPITVMSGSRFEGYYPTAASLDGEYLISWTDQRTAVASAYATRMDATSGELLDGDGFHLSGTSGTCGTLVATPSVTSPQASGTSITISATSTCTTSPAVAEYQFWVQSSSGLSLAKDYSLSPNFVWNTQGLAAGTYSVITRVRRAGSSVPFDDQNTIADYVLQ